MPVRALDTVQVWGIYMLPQFQPDAGLKEAQVIGPGIIHFSRAGAVQRDSHKFSPLQAHDPPLPRLPDVRDSPMPPCVLHDGCTYVVQSVLHTLLSFDIIGRAVFRKVSKLLSLDTPNEAVAHSK